MLTHGQLRERFLSGDNVDVVTEMLALEVEEAGADRFIVGFVRGAARGFDGRWRLYRHRSHNFPERWEEGWGAFNAHCPYYHSCFDGRIAFDWASVRDRGGLSHQETRAWNYLADFGLVKGFTVPVHAPGHFGFLTVIGENSDRRWAERIERNSQRLLFLAHVFHETVREGFPELMERPEEPLLSVRERECLRWAAAGKTTEDVALILGLSPETVRVYFKRAIRKMGATTRTQAIARACEADLLS